MVFETYVNFVAQIMYFFSYRHKNLKPENCL